MLKVSHTKPLYDATALMADEAMWCETNRAFIKGHGCPKLNARSFAGRKTNRAFIWQVYWQFSRDSAVLGGLVWRKAVVLLKGLWEWQYSVQREEQAHSPTKSDGDSAVLERVDGGERWRNNPSGSRPNFFGRQHLTFDKGGKLSAFRGIVRFWRGWCGKMRGVLLRGLWD